MALAELSGVFDLRAAALSRLQSGSDRGPNRRAASGERWVLCAGVLAVPRREEIHRVESDEANPKFATGRAAVESRSGHATSQRADRDGIVTAIAAPTSSRVLPARNGVSTTTSVPAISTP